MTTGTASGKTLAFNLPVLDALAREPKNRALYLYPTKALAQDQFRTLDALPACRGCKPAIYDGDTPTEQRWQIRKWSNADPDEPGHGARRRCCRTTTAGATCSRTCATWSSTRRTSTAASSARTSRTSCGGCGGSRASTARSRSSCSRSATISNPGELGAALLGDRVTVIGDDAAPRAERTVVLWNPPLLDAELGAARVGARGGGEAPGELRRARPAHAHVREEPQGRRADPPLHRRAARRRLAPLALPRRLHGSSSGARSSGGSPRGELLGVSATNALELGIDIGLLDAVISVGFPGTVASLRQQWGRAGRRGHGLAVLVATEDALDQYFMREPDKLLGRRVEAAILDHANPRVLAGHVRAAAYEAPLDDDDAEILGAEALAARARPTRSCKQTPRGHRLGRRGPPGGARRRCARPTPTRSPIVDAVDRRRARPRRALARVLDRARGRGLPAPRRVVPRPRARPDDAARGRRAVHGRLVHAGEEGDR